MAAAKTSKTKTKKTTSKTKAVGKTTKSTKTKTTKAKGTTKATTAKKNTKGTTVKSAKVKDPIAVFLTNIVKNSTKEFKSVQAQTKKILKDLNAQDKQLADLYKKQAKASSGTRQGLDTKITKLQTQMSSTRTTLLTYENAADKIATLVEWVEQLNSRPSTTTYLSTPAQTPSRPTLVQTSPNSKSATKAAQSKKPAKQEDLFDDEDLQDDDIYPEDEGDDELGFAFGEDDDDEVRM